MTIMTMVPADGAIVADKNQLRKSTPNGLTNEEESRKSILMCLPRGSFHDREKYHKKKKKSADGLSSSSSHSRSSLRGSRSSHRVSLVDFDLNNIREYERYPGLDDVPLNELWLMKEDLIKFRAEFMHDAMGVIQHEQQQREKNEPLRDDQRHIFLQVFRHCQKLKAGDESDSLDMSLRDALYHIFKRYGWTRVGLVALTIEEVYRDNQERRSRILQAVKDFQQQNHTKHRDDSHELLRVACERISYGPSMFARYLGWSTTKIVYRK